MPLNTGASMQTPPRKLPTPRSGGTSPLAAKTSQSTPRLSGDGSFVSIQQLGSKPRNSSLPSLADQLNEKNMLMRVNVYSRKDSCKSLTGSDYSGTSSPRLSECGSVNPDSPLRSLNGRLGNLSMSPAPMSLDSLQNSLQTKKVDVSSYKLESLTKGGQGAVYKGVDPSTGDIVAVKLTDTTDRQNKDNCSREVEVYQKLTKVIARHSNLSYAREIVRAKEETALFLDFYPTDLFNMMKTSRDKIGPREALIIADKIMCAVHFLHENKVVHRDIKAENILMTTTDVRTAEPILCDYGLCGIIEKGPYLTSSCGSKRYSAPEVWAKAKEETYDGRLVDVFSVGILFFGLLTGFFPWESADKSNKIFKLWCSDVNVFFLWANKHSKNPISSSSKVLFRGLCHPIPEKRISVVEARNFIRAELDEISKSS